MSVWQYSSEVALCKHIESTVLSKISVERGRTATDGSVFMSRNYSIVDGRNLHIEIN